MKKEIDELTKEELLEIAAEITRMFTFGSACLVTAARNANQSPKGWPSVITGDTEISLCNILDTLVDYNVEDVANNLGYMAAMADPEELAKVSLHQAMHDAFCLGIAAVTLMEMDFSGLEEVLDELRNQE